MKLTIRIEGSGKTILAESGDNLMRVLSRNSVWLNAACGGKGSCGKCKVKLIEGSVEGESPDENGMIRACKSTLRQDIKIEPFNYGYTVKRTTARHSVGRICKLAVDIGTTTLAMALTDAGDGEVIGEYSALNAQANFGADVISRIAFCTRGGLSDVHRAITDQINFAAKTMMSEFGIEKISETVVTGNTTMLHIFAGVSPGSIGVAPYSPVFTEVRKLRGVNNGMPDCGDIVIMPSVSGYIGADVVAGAVHCALKDKEMLVDLGTNGEIMLRNGDKYYCTSTAVGPAFEGASTECGTGGISGAVCRFGEKDGKPCFETVNDAPPVGICGAGLIDTVAYLLKKGFVDFTGSADDTVDGGFVNGRFGIAENVYISDADIRKFQLAKSAVCSGIETLMGTAGVKPDEIRRVVLAGGIGKYTDIGNAVYTGVLPECIAEVAEVGGNTGLAGAVDYLNNENARTLAEQIKRQSEIVDLASDIAFSERFVENMMFANGR